MTRIRLHEDPDGVDFNGVVTKFDQHDASTFIYYVQSELLFLSKTGKFSSSSRVFHSDLVDLFGKIGGVFRDESRYEYNDETGEYGEDPLPIQTVDEFNQHCDMMGYDIYWDEAGGWIRWSSNKKTVQIYGDTDKTIAYMKSQAGKNSNNLKGYRLKFSSVGVMGRYWEDTQILAFWMMKRDLGRLLSKGGLNGLFEFLGLDKENTRLATANDDDGLISVRDALEAAGAKPTMTRAQELELMKKQHLDPDSKRKLNKDTDMPDKYGGILPAQYHAWSRQSDGHIKMGDLIKECPDAVLNDEGTPRWYWRDGKNWAFFCFPEFSIAYRGKMHSQVLKMLNITRSSMSLKYIHFEQDSAYQTLFVSDEQSMMEALADSGSIVNDVLDAPTGHGDDFRQDSRLLVGRLWTDRDVISFWTSQHDVLHNWKMVEQMFRDIPVLGRLTDYEVDWTERDADYEGGLTPRPMTPADEITHGTFTGNRSPDEPPRQDNLSSVPDHDPKDETGQLNFLAKMFQEPKHLEKADDDLLKKIREKMHVLDPQAKAQVMKAVGNVTPHKAAQIADKLGMSVAEFNHIMHVNESAIQLRNLMPDS